MIAANMPEMLTLLHQHNAVLQGLLSAQENAAVAAATAHAAMERRFSQVLLLGEGRRRLGGGSVDATAQTSPRLTLLPSAPSPTARGVPAASGLGLTVSVAPEPRALFQALPEDGGIADDSGVAVGAGMGIGDGTVAGVGIVSVGGGGIHGGRPRRRSVGTHLQLTTTTTTVYEEEEEQQQEYDNKEEVVGDQGQKQGSEGHADRRRLDSTCRTPASKGNGPGTALRVRSVVRVQQTHTQHHCSVVEHELFPVAPEQEEYGGEALKCGDLRGPPPSSQSPLSVQQQRRGLQPIRNGDAQPAYKEGATGCREQPSSPQRQPPQGHLREGCKQAHLIWQPQQQLQTETRQRQKEQEKQQNQRPVQQKGHRAEEGRMADIVMRAVDIQTDAKKDTQGRVGVLGASSGAAGAGGRTAAKKGDVLPASLPLTELLPSAAVTVMAAQQNRCRGGAEGNRIGKPFAVAPKPLPKTAAVAEAVANAAAPMADWDEEVLPLALRREKRGCRKPEGGGTDASVSITVHGTGAAVIAKEPGAVIRRSARQRAKLGDGVHSGPLDATAIVDGITNVAADAKNLAVKSKAPTKPAQQPTQWKRKADPTEPNMLNSEHPQLLSAAEQPAKRAGCGSKKPQLNHQNTIEPQKEPQPGINLSPQSRSSGGALKKGSREGASKVFTRSGGRRREPTEGAHGNGGGDNGVVAAKIAAAAAPTNDNGMDRIHETTTGAGRSVKGKKAAKAAPALPHPKATATGPILCGGNDGNNNAVAVKKLCRRVVPATGTSVAKGAAGHSRPGTRAQNTNMASNAFAILTVVSECTDNPGSSGFGLTSQSPTPASTANATADGWNQRDVDAPGSSNGQALPKSLPGSLAGRAHGNVSGNREDDEEADEFARLVAARMLRHRQKRMKLMLASTQGAAVHS
ncbi:hypothetical protein Vretifemale_17218 [Volvox reticuliferus]|uniref:Uncharacterized protein n=1 Tax=Volvox reticuliferus TaxID=1737510 RepID=A0A8J4D0U0_9CHLO|nr:hypothetical protein Vretifemale_17218 [Volvox reticuliferus]